MHSVTPFFYIQTFDRDINNNFEYKRTRRIYRDKVIASILENNKFIIDQQRHRIYHRNQIKYFSASYAANDILLALLDKPIGVDLERYDKLTKEKGDLFLNPTEKVLMKRTFKGKRDIPRITMMWCLKECVGKLLGVGLLNGMNNVRFVDMEEQAQYILYTYYSFMKERCFAISSWNCLEE